MPTKKKLEFFHTFCRDNFVENSYEEMIGNSIESEISKISNTFGEDLEEAEILTNPIFGDSPLESPKDESRIIDDAQILAQNPPKGSRECRFCGREVPWGKHVSSSTLNLKFCTL